MKTISLPLVLLTLLTITPYFFAGKRKDVMAAIEDNELGIVKTLIKKDPKLLFEKK